MSLLAHRPDVVQKIRDEIKEVLGNRKEPDFDDIKKFTYIEMVIKETLRMRPPVPLLDRMVAEDTTFGDTTLKAGVWFFILI